MVVLVALVHCVLATRLSHLVVMPPIVTQRYRAMVSPMSRMLNTQPVVRHEFFLRLEEDLFNKRFRHIFLSQSIFFHKTNSKYFTFITYFISFPLPVCKAGYFKSGSSCLPCTGNEIKSTPGDTTDCTADPPCDGTTKVPNDDHTACGE